jgi:hypothetical protein
MCWSPSWRAVAVVGALLAVTTGPPPVHPAAAPPEGAARQPGDPAGMVVGLPGYFYPGPAWSAVAAGSPLVRYVIANPASGPGQARDASYVSVVAASRAAGVVVLGYVSTRWGTRPLGEVLQEIDDYRDWYGISSIFLDEAASAESGLPYYRQLSLAVRRTPGALVALNPGTVPDERYAALVDLLVVFEGDYSAYRAWTPPHWQDRYPRQRFWHLVYATPPGEAEQALQAAERHSAGVVYVTDAELDNPWDRLPSYWSQALEAVRALNS